MKVKYNRVSTILQTERSQATGHKEFTVKVI